MTTNHNDGQDNFTKNIVIPIVYYNYINAVAIGSVC